ncbi:hypothetical protein G6O69_13910 [Pseudenhygromyxa sp. WMMC2535]|uniref:TRAP transporter TatT component family protein n=1 Tax=Pseudenhygromyxa sp. WMMC2535 TaxID=2712867 RepID=UPI0015561FD1|nr:TRAP transporter TatT component family protein [Pseudenhygromyxa sp. WMMC2535]NVB38932.1 hypothetical protein [Pseudenhygromyxa sp. WMMC2535]
MTHREAPRARPRPGLLALSVTLAVVCGCKGRTAAWEERPPREGSRPPASGPGSRGVRAQPGVVDLSLWSTRGQGSEQTQAVIAAWEVGLGCTPGATAPAERCPELATTSENAEALAMLTRAHYFLADAYLRDNAADYLDHLDRGVWWGERALMAVSPEFATEMTAGAKFHEAIVLVGAEGLPAMYWYASALGKWARARGYGVLVRQRDNIQATMTHIMALDPSYYHGGPDRYFGAYYAVAPEFTDGDLDKSRQHYEASLEIAPHFIGTKVLMAENLAVKLGDEALFDRLLQEVLDADLGTAPPELQPEFNVEKIKAQELLKKKEREKWF